MDQPKSYRNSQALSQSDLKLFRASITDFYNQVIAGERIDKSSKQTLVGDMVDAYFTDKTIFTKYKASDTDCSEALQDIVNTAITDIVKTAPDEQIAELLSSPEIAKEYLCKAARLLKWNNRYGVEALGKAIVKDAGAYYKFKAMYPEHIIVSATVHKKAISCIDRLEKDPKTGPLLNGSLVEADDTKHRFRIEKQVELYGRYADTETKGLLDLLIIDLVNRILYPYDIKTTATMRRFMQNYYSYGYGYQGSFYSDLLTQNFPDFKVEPFRFIVGATETAESPMIYKMSPNECLLYAQGGMDKRGYRVMGWHETIMDYEWHRNTNQWAYPRNYYKFGEMLIDSVYTEEDFSDVL